MTNNNNNNGNKDSVKAIIKESVMESMESDKDSASKPVLFQKKLIPFSLSLFLAIALSILFFFILYNFKDVNISLGRFFSALKPFIYGGIIAYILVPMCNKYEQWLTALIAHFSKADKKKSARKMAKAPAIILSFLTAFLIIYILLSLIIPQLIVSLTLVSGNLTTYYNTILDWIGNTFKNNELLRQYAEDLTNTMSDTISNFIKTELLPSTRTLVTSVSSGVMNAVAVAKNLFIGIIVAIYLLSSRETFAAQCKILIHSILKEKHANRLIKEVNFTNRMFMGFISGRLVDSAIIGVLCCIGLTIMDMPYAFLVSVLVGVTNVIPFFGPFIGGIPSGLLILMVDPVKCIWFAVFILILQQIDGNIIGPKILGEMTNLNSFWVLFAIMLFSGLFGFAGMLVGVPVFAVIYHLSQELILKGLKRTGYVPDEKEAVVSGYNDMLEERRLEESIPADSTAQTNGRKTLTQRLFSFVKNITDKHTPDGQK